MEASGNTFIYVHLIWNTADKKAVLSSIIRRVLFPFVKQNAQAKGIQLIAVNGVENHVHCLLKMLPFQNLQSIVSTIKQESETWLNENKLLTEVFNWSDGYAAYSVSPSTTDKSVEYINKQEEYHKTRSLEEEMQAFEKMVIPLGAS